MNDIVGLDFETYSAVDIKVHGADRYVNDPTFKVLMAGLAYPPGSGYPDRIVDFTSQPNPIETLSSFLAGKKIVAHNAFFEGLVLKALNIDVPWARLIDSAAVGRAYGAGSRLAVAAPQLLNMQKMDEGLELIKLFSIPSKQQREDGELHFDKSLPTKYPNQWQTFKDYCLRDAVLGLRIYDEVTSQGFFSTNEEIFCATTLEMNHRGWPVDVASVEEMYSRYRENIASLEEDFRTEWDARDLNINSHQQLTAWCRERGIRAKSFDKKSVERMLKAIKKKLDQSDAGAITLDQEVYVNYCAVTALFELKQAVGGSSLKKLPVILDTVGHDKRLRDQYTHIGAALTWRTSGRSVQMQNLKRLSSELKDIQTLQDPFLHWTNEDMADNMRQLFTSSDMSGALLVGDFSSIESRALAWQAGADWKLNAYRQGQDLYKVLASTIYGVPYQSVTKEQRQFGKVGELSCGYNAGGPAVRDFASGMGVELTEGEASDLVFQWRNANPEIVRYWARLDQALHAALAGPAQAVPLKVEGSVELFTIEAPNTLKNQLGDPRAQSLVITVYYADGKSFSRIFHGIRKTGNVITYYRAAETKNGQLWKRTFTDPKTKKEREYTLYGGKLAGIITQSLCREIFFWTLRAVDYWARWQKGLEVIGQFHDEIVVDWQPSQGAVPLSSAINGMRSMMNSAHGLTAFPMATEVQYAYRYIK